MLSFRLKKQTSKNVAKTTFKFQDKYKFVSIYHSALGIVCRSFFSYDKSFFTCLLYGCRLEQKKLHHHLLNYNQVINIVRNI